MHGIFYLMTVPKSISPLQDLWLTSRTIDTAREVFQLISGLSEELERRQLHLDILPGPASDSRYRAMVRILIPLCRNINTYTLTAVGNIVDSTFNILLARYYIHHVKTQNRQWRWIMLFLQCEHFISPWIISQGGASCAVMCPGEGAEWWCDGEDHFLV